MHMTLFHLELAAWFWRICGDTSINSPAHDWLPSQYQPIGAPFLRGGKSVSWVQQVVLRKTLAQTELNPQFTNLWPFLSAAGGASRCSPYLSGPFAVLRDRTPCRLPAINSAFVSLSWLLPISNRFESFSVPRSLPTKQWRCGRSVWRSLSQEFNTTWYRKIHFIFMEYFISRNSLTISQQYTLLPSLN